MTSRRSFIGITGIVMVSPALAHHGWSSFDANRPLYLEGRVVSVSWRNPHVDLELEVDPGLRLPADIAQRRVPAQSAPVDGAALLARAELPRRRDRVWKVELAPVSRMRAWKVPEIKTGEPVSLLGFTFNEEKGDPVLRAEYLWLRGQTYALRSSPA